MPQKSVQKLAYGLFNGNVEAAFIGEASFGIADDDPRWKIKKLAYELDVNGVNHVSLIQTLRGVAWTDRETLPWS